MNAGSAAIIGRQPEKNLILIIVQNVNLLVGINLPMKNQQKCNQTAVNKILEWHKTTKLEDINWQKLASDFRVAGGACVICSKPSITAPIMKFFDWDSSRFICYHCQETMRTEDDIL